MDLKSNAFIFASPLEKGLLNLKDSVAQLVEHLTFNQGVLGSNPSGITEIPANQVDMVVTST